MVKIKDGILGNQDLIGLFTDLFPQNKFSEGTIQITMQYYLKVFINVRARDLCYRFNSNITKGATVGLRQTLASGKRDPTKVEKPGGKKPKQQSTKKKSSSKTSKGDAIDGMTKKELKAALKAKKLLVSGKKEVLQDRLREAIAKTTKSDEPTKTDEPAKKLSAKEKKLAKLEEQRLEQEKKNAEAVAKKKKKAEEAAAKKKKKAEEATANKKKKAEEATAKKKKKAVGAGANTTATKATKKTSNQTAKKTKARAKTGTTKLSTAAAVRISTVANGLSKKTPTKTVTKSKKQTMKQPVQKSQSGVLLFDFDDGYVSSDEEDEPDVYTEEVLSAEKENRQLQTIAEIDNDDSETYNKYCTEVEDDEHMGAELKLN